MAKLDPFRQHVEAKGWADEQLRATALQSVDLHAHGEKDEAAQLLGEALALAEPEGFIRIFVDEGPPTARLRNEAEARGIAPEYTQTLLAAFSLDEPESAEPSKEKAAIAELVEPLSERLLEGPVLIADRLTNREIAERLDFSLNTVKVHTRSIYGKLGVMNRTQAVAQARALGILTSS